jgi:hypothetical protein
MESAGLVSYGFGDALLAHRSATQAFAEAWERLWFRMATKDRAFLGRRVMSSNGFAAGRDPVSAVAAATAEIVERAIVLTAWGTRLGWTPVPAQGVWTRILTTRLAKAGWNVRFFTLREPRLGNVMCGLGTHTDEGAIFDSAFHSKMTGIATVQAKVARSIMRSLITSKASTFDRSQSAFDPTPSGHAAYYRVRERLAAFDFLSTSGPQTPIALGHYDRTSSHVVFSGKPLPSVAIAHNDWWPQLRWGEAPVNPDGNPWPHPIA